MQHCILCGQPVAPSSDIRPGTPARCQAHAWKNLEAWETFTVEEARREGIKRVASISLDEMKEEGLVAFHQLERWEQELSNPEVRGALRQHTLDIIAAKRAYLSAFD